MRKRLRNWWNELTPKKILLFISVVITFLLYLLVTFWIRWLTGGQVAQEMSERWSNIDQASQISCFFSVNAGITEDFIEEFEHQLDTDLKEASIETKSENPGARLWADCYGASGKISMANNGKSVSVDAFGIGGDFFSFHPLPLVNGSYFSGNDLMKDYVVLDEEAAWQLFGSNNIAGMMVNIAGKPFLVAGVIKHPDSKIYKNAGLTASKVYVSLETLETYGMSNGISFYEIVMPNPVKDYAVSYMNGKFGSYENNVEMVENGTRYKLSKRWDVMRAFGTRSMNGKAIIYPYWENVARGYEDYAACLTLFQILLIVYPMLVIIGWIVIRWKNKKWTAWGIYCRIRDAWSDFWIKRGPFRRKNGDVDPTSWLDDL